MGSFIGTDKVVKFQESRLFNKRTRNIARDFGPGMIILFLSFFNQLKFMRVVSPAAGF